MAQSEVRSVTAVALEEQGVTLPFPAERKFRRISAWLLLLFLIMGELGAVWDREWHAYVGRDQFWTPPHTLIYTCVAGAGILALIVVLLETYRYRRGVPGVDRHSTVSIFWFFHAPLGFSVLGFGALLALVAAPLDNYWHELYGIDVALWAPFHMMGVTGGLIGILGMIYVFASEAAIERQAERQGVQGKRYVGLSALELGAIMAMASFLNFVLTGFLQFPLVSLGTIQISTYPLPLVAGGAFCLISVARFTRRAGTATLLTAFLLLHTLLVELFVPWAVRVAVAQQGLHFRDAGKEPYFSLAYAFLPLVFLISALIVDGFIAWQQRRSQQAANKQLIVGVVGLIISPPIFLVAPWILRYYSDFAPVFLPVPGVPYAPEQMLLAVVLGVITALIAGVLGAWMGSDFGDIWRWSKH